MPPWLQRLLGVGQSGLRDSILGVLSRNSEPAREIHPDRFGGLNNPVILDETIVQAQTPLTVRERVAKTQFPRLSVLPPMLAQMPGEPDYDNIMARAGILPEMRSETPLLAERLYEAIFPLGYANREGLDPGTWDPRHKRALRALVGLENSPRPLYEPEREDAWRLYLGLPQTGGTFSVSDYQPSISTDRSSTYMSMPGFLSEMANLHELVTGRRPTDAEVIKGLLNQVGASDWMIAQDAMPGVMGNYRLSRGEDERGKYLSYYDIWDLDGSYEGSEGFFGRPFEIYDRIYYDPRTFEPLNVPR